MANQVLGEGSLYKGNSCSLAYCDQPGVDRGESKLIGFENDLSTQN